MHFGHDSHISSVCSSGKTFIYLQFFMCHGSLHNTLLSPPCGFEMNEAINDLT